MRGTFKQNNCQLKHPCFFLILCLSLTIYFCAEEINNNNNNIRIIKNCIAFSSFYFYFFWYFPRWTLLEMPGVQRLVFKVKRNPWGIKTRVSDLPHFNSTHESHTSGTAVSVWVVRWAKPFHRAEITHNGVFMVIYVSTRESLVLKGLASTVLSYS